MTSLMTELLTDWVDWLIEWPIDMMNAGLNAIVRMIDWLTTLW